jgi:hypothetical protein
MMSKELPKTPLFVDDGGTGEPAILFIHRAGDRRSSLNPRSLRMEERRE